MFKYSLSVPSTYLFASSFNKPQKKSTYVYHSNKIRGNTAIEQMLLQLKGLLWLGHRLLIK